MAIFTERPPQAVRAAMELCFESPPAALLPPLLSFFGPNGRTPQGGLVLGADGAFYGITLSGGVNNLGTIYKMTQDGALADAVVIRWGRLGAQSPSCSGAGW